jgi:leucyl aminopeptidase
MVSEKAMRPGDILTSSNGKTIEVINTDAEGRLTLADALVFAEGLGGGASGKPALDAIVDVATLTGAVIIALGDKYAGLWTSSDKLAEAIGTAAKRSGELLWRMPLAPEYMDQLKSPIADLKNVGGRGGSSISAALFLKEFVKEAPWAHLDIAGTVWNDGAGGPTGYGVRTLYRLAEDAPQTEFKDKELGNVVS